MRNIKRNLLVYLSYFVSVVFLYLTLEGIDYHELSHSLKGIELSAIILASLLYLTTFLVRGQRVKLILDNELPYKESVVSNLISYALNNFIPLKGGDIYKIHFLQKHANIRKSVSTATVLIERLFDLASVLIIFSIVISYMNVDVVSWDMSNLITVLIALILVLVLSIFAIHKFKHVNLENYIKIANPDSLHSFIECWGRLLGHRHFTSVLCLSLLIWVMEGLVFYVVLGFVDVQFAIIWMCVLALSFVVPNAPGNIGLFEWVSIFILSSFGYGEEEALSMGLIAHAVQFVSVTVIGMALFFIYKRVAQKSD